MSVDSDTCFRCTKTRDAKGRKVSGNFGNFPWKVSGILKGWEFLEILGIFNFDLFSIFFLDCLYRNQQN